MKTTLKNYRSERLNRRCTGKTITTPFTVPMAFIKKHRCILPLFHFHQDGRRYSIRQACSLELRSSLASQPAGSRLDKYQLVVDASIRLGWTDSVCLLGVTKKIKTFDWIQFLLTEFNLSVLHLQKIISKTIFVQEFSKHEHP